MKKLIKEFIEENFNALSAMCCILGVVLWSFDIAQYPRLSFGVAAGLAFVAGLNVAAHVDKKLV